MHPNLFTRVSSFVARPCRRAGWLGALGLMLALPGLAATNYTIDLSVNPAGYGTVTGVNLSYGGGLTNGSNLVNDPVGAGVDLSVTATNFGSTIFSSWGGTLAASLLNSNSLSTTLALEQSGTLIANFDLRSSLTVAASPLAGGTTVPTGTTVVPRSKAYPIKATANAGYEFMRWQVNGAGSPIFADPFLAETTVVPNGNPMSINAVFQVMPRLQVTAPAGCDVYINSSLVPAGTSQLFSFPTNSIVDVTANVVDGTKDFQSWFPVTGTVAGNASNITEQVVMSKNKSLSVVLQAKIEKCTLVTATGGNGTVNPNGTNYYVKGSEISISPLPAAGYMFLKWTDINGANINKALETMNPLTLTLSTLPPYIYNYKALFTNLYTVTATAMNGPGTPAFSFNVAAGTAWSNTPPLLTKGNQTIQDRIAGYAAGTGDVIPAVGPGDIVLVPKATTDSSLTWVWQRQYKLVTRSNAGGSVSPDTGADGIWVDAGAAITFSAVAEVGFVLDHWTTNGVRMADANDNFTLTMNSPLTVDAVFVAAGDRYIPLWWKKLFGLDSSATDPNDGPEGDPDNDGLSNWQEFSMMITNTPNKMPIYMNPINADTDGDGMDDGWEVRVFDFAAQASNTPDTVYISAALIKNNTDNPDGDYLWSTNTGYAMKDQVLNNITEYTGPDGAAPLIVVTPWTGVFTNGGAAVAWRKDVRVLTSNPADTGDWSDPTKSDSDLDGLDDGYEFSWDRWQMVNGGRNIQDTNNWPKITGTVPVWVGNTISTRPYHPNSARIVDSDTLAPDYDWQYDKVLGTTAGAWGDLLEYRASQVSFSTNNAYPVVRAVKMPDPLNPWCTNPFLWDTDGDGLSDGWEVTFGYDPWAKDTDMNGVADGAENPDGDAYVGGGSLFHYEVYVTNGFNPSVAWLPNFQTKANFYSNTLEFIGYGIIGMGSLKNSEPAWLPGTAPDGSSNPHNVDTDSDGMFDGWEMYLGFDPTAAADGGADDDQDGLANWQEFLGSSVMTYWQGRVAAGVTPAKIQPAWSNFTLSWPNKTLPTDPFNPDTDNDQMSDSAEQTAFNYSTNGRAGAGGGLNPDTVDTDMDYLPDYWETYWAGSMGASNVWGGGMDGTVGDAFLDYDGDGLYNYQEYLVGACYQFQWLYNNGTGTLDDPNLSNYDPYDFFNIDLSGGGLGDCMTGPGALGAYPWDPAYFADRMALAPYKRFTFLSAAPALGPWNFSTTNPGDVDTDHDGYDDFYEIYHNLNPVRGGMDRVYGKVMGVPEAADMLYAFPYDYSTPFRWGELPVNPIADFDQDGQVDMEEGLTPNLPAILPYHHTDPSPYFVADISSDGSWVNKFYKTGWTFGAAMYWFWDDLVLMDMAYPAAYLFTFEANEGYDTDNDMVMDGQEIVGDTPGATDPLDEDSPLRQRALYLDGGTDSAARLFSSVVNPWTSFRAFTIEAWVRPQAIDGDRVIVERAGMITANNPGLPEVAGVHRNFRLGINNGIPYIGYDGYGVSWVYNVVTSTPNYRLAANRWAHLAGVFDAQAKRLTLYVNGEMAGSRSTQQIPFNGFVAGNPNSDNTPLVTGMMLTVGAADENPGGVLDGSRDNIKSGMYPWSGFQPALSFPSFANQWAGWVDEIRCWDGTRTQDQIKQLKNEKLTRGMVNAINGVTTGDENVYGGLGGSEMNPRLVYAYTFDALPDPKQGIEPAGFSSAVQPPDWTAVEWWDLLPMASTVYNDRKYVKWIQNMASHQPYDPPRDSKVNPWRTVSSMSTNILPDGTVVTNYAYVTNFPNTANPYVFEYVHGLGGSTESHPQYTSTDSGLYGDLLPLGNVEGDDDVPMWDGKSVNNPIDLRDQDGDGMPDRWEEQHGLNPFDPSDALLDPDGDGLNNLQEYQVGGDPFGIYSLDPNQVLKDSDFDSDHDGLPNGLEASYGTSLILPDTDDDGIIDGQEVQHGMDPAYSLSPAVSRVLRLDGGAGTWLEGPSDQSRFLSSGFTAAAWVNLKTLGGTIIACEPDPGIFNYRIRVLPSGALVADFTTFDRLTTVSLTSPNTALLSTGVWTHVAASFDAPSRKFTLLYNGREVASLFATTLPCISGYGPTRVSVGTGVAGDIDEVAMFNVALTEDRIMSAMKGVDLLGAASLAAYYAFDDGTNGFSTVSGYTGWNTGHVQDFAITNTDWLTGWKSAGTLVGAAQVVPLDEAPVNINMRDTDSDGMPDGWETAFGLDPKDPTGNQGASGDPDGDGLSNLYEYWAGTHPLLRDTDENGVEDGQEDGDADGLKNLDEQDLYGTHPGLEDTDDDGVADYDEAIGEAGVKTSDPVNSMNPPKRLSAQFDGTGWMEVPENEILQLSSWTVHAWVNPAAPGLWPSDRMVVLRREIMNTRFGGQYAGVNYELGLKRVNGQIRPYVRYGGVALNGVIQYKEVDGKGDVEVHGSEQVSGLIGSDEWAHILGVYDPIAQKLSLYVNGQLVAYRLDAFKPTGVGLTESWLMKGHTTVGAAVVNNAAVNGFVGHVDDVTILAGVVDNDGAWTAADKVKPLEATVFAAPSVPASVVKSLDLKTVATNSYRPNQVLVRFKDAPAPATVASRAASFKTAVSQSFTLVPVHVLTITDGKSVPDKIAELKQDPNVLYAEPNFVRSFNTIPNDPSFSSQWALNNTGQSGGTPDADIDAPEAWDGSKGSAGIIVAVLDSGMDVTHPDLAPNVWVNSGEIPGNGIDDDNNGYIDDVNGYDFFNMDGDPDDPAWLGHGTHVSGTIGAAGNNGIGVAGVNWNVRLMACKVGDYWLSDSAIVAAFEYAIRMGARVANCSFGGYYYSQAEYDAIAAANSAGMLVVCAAGNDALDTDVDSHYPSSYDLPNIISVAASTRFDELASFSNYGQNSVDVAAPGLDILSTRIGGGYWTMSGTSMASPHVAGLAALVASMYPAMSHLTWKQIILGSVELKPAFNGKVLTGGRINARKALSGGGTPVAYFSFNDGGDTVEDSTQAFDWKVAFKHAGVWHNGAVFSPTVFMESYLDTDADGLPDWWEIANGLDPFNSDGVNGPDGDSDGDGLTNYTEYRAGTNPNNADSDHDGLSDKNEDSDGDGLTNLEEQNAGTDAGLTDTDDDGIADGQELANRTDPINAWSPELRRAVSFNGNGRLLVKTERDADSTTDWTVEAWVKPASQSASGILVRRAETTPFLTTNGVPLLWVDYELGLSAGVPYAKFAYRDNLGEKLITVTVQSDRPVGEKWVHLAAVRQFDPFELRLFVDGKEMGRSNPGVIQVASVSGGFETTIGGGTLSGATVQNGFDGLMDAVRIWPYARLSYEIQENRNVLLPEFVNGVADLNRAPRRLFNFDDGGTLFQNDIFGQDWKTGWSHAAKAQGGAAAVSTVLSDFVPSDFDQDDDEITDYTELSRGWYEKRSDWPYIEKHLSFAGNGEVVVDERIDGEQTEHYALTTWTLETWVRPQMDVTSRMPLITRRVLDGNTSGVERVTFELGLKPNGANAQLPRAYVKFNRSDAGYQPVELVGGFVPSVTGATNWTHVAAVYDKVERTLKLYINGVIVGNLANVAAAPYAPPAGEVVFGGAGFTGDMKEIRIWNVARSAAEIESTYQMPILFSTSIQNSFDGNAQSYIGRPTVTNDGAYNYDYTFDIPIDDWVVQGGWITHPFTLDTWIKMDSSSPGGIIMERKVESGFTASGYLVSEGLRIEGDGHLTGYIEGWVTEYTPVYVIDSNTNQRILREVDAIDVLHRRPLTSELDLRDGKWHHVAFVGDTENMFLYIDGRLDAKTDSYYFLFTLLGGTTFEGMFQQVDNEGSVLRIGGTLPDDMSAGSPNYHPMFDGMIDEPMFWNVDMRQDQIMSQMDYGLSRPDIQAGLQTIYPLPQSVIDDGRPHHRLVSYVIFDGVQNLPKVRDLVPKREPYIIMPRMLGGELVLNSMPPIAVDPLRAYDAELRGYFACDDGGNTVENYIFRNDQSYAGLLYGDASFVQFGDAFNPVATDTDRDGIPDVWETIYGFNPEDPLDVYADDDGDGLGNMHEYLAGSNPMNPMSLNGKTSDFFAQTGSVYRTVGEELTDLDWMDDLWEVAYGLNPDVFDGVGAGSDPDQDGWSNLSEFQDLVNWILVSSGGGTNAPFGGAQAGPAVMLTENHPLANSDLYNALENLFRSERLPVLENGMTYQQQWNSPIDDNRHPLPEMIFRFQYSGIRRWEANDTFVVMAYSDRAMEAPDAVISGAPDRLGAYPSFMVLNPSITNSAVAQGYVREGQNWFWGFMDLNNDGLYQDTEPAGFAGPVNVRMGSVGPIDIPLTDKRPMGFARFSWGQGSGNSTNAIDPSIVDAYHVYIVDKNVANAPTVFYRVYSPFRTFTMEADLMAIKKLAKGLKRPGGYQWYVRAEYNNVLHDVKTGMVYENYKNPMPVPTLVWPVGNVRLRQSLDTFIWKMDPSVTYCTLVVKRRDSGATVLTKSFAPPACDVFGRSKMEMPIYIGDGVFQNGVYDYTLTVRTPVSSASSTASFTVKTGNYPGYSYSLTGELVYPGKVTSGTFVVEAFPTPGFGGVPAGRRLVVNSTTAAAWPTNVMPFTIRGLPQGHYYLRAFLDQNNAYPNYTADDFESQGWFARNFYWPKSIEVTSEKTATLNDQIKVLMRDTDNDRLPDDWEYRWNGNLTAFGPGSLRGYTPALTGSLNVFECYGYSALGATPN